MNLMFLILLINSAFPSSFNQAKQAAAMLKSSPKSPERQEAPTKVSIETPKDESGSEGLNDIICPKVSNQFLNSSTGSLRAMQDLFETYVQYEENTINFYLTMLGFDKRNPEHEMSVGKLVEIERSVNQKLSRAKSNYNDEIKNLASTIVKAKKCWSYHPTESKEQISRFLDIFQKEKTLKDFKMCTETKEFKIKLLKQQFSHTIRFYNKEITEKTYTVEFQKIERELIKLNKTDSNRCKDFHKNGKYFFYFQGKYDHKMELEKNEETSTIVPNQFPLTPLGW